MPTVPGSQMPASNSSPQGSRMFLNTWSENSWWCYGTQEHLTFSFVTHCMWKPGLNHAQATEIGVLGIDTPKRQPETCLFKQKGAQLCATCMLTQKSDTTRSPFMMPKKTLGVRCQLTAQESGLSTAAHICPACPAPKVAPWGPVLNCSALPAQRERYFACPALAWSLAGPGAFAEHRLRWEHCQGKGAERLQRCPAFLIALSC